jgi:hypothetical protein
MEMSKGSHICVVILWCILSYCVVGQKYLDTAGFWSHVAGSTSPIDPINPNKYGVNLGDKFVAYSAISSPNIPVALSASCGAIDTSTGLIFTYGGALGGIDIWDNISASNALWMFNTSAYTWTWLSGTTVNLTLWDNSPGQYPSARSNISSLSYFPSSRMWCGLAAINNAVYLYGGYGLGYNLTSPGKGAFAFNFSTSG